MVFELLWQAENHISFGPCRHDMSLVYNYHRPTQGKALANDLQPALRDRKVPTFLILLVFSRKSHDEARYICGFQILYGVTLLVYVCYVYVHVLYWLIFVQMSSNFYDVFLKTTSHPWSRSWARFRSEGPLLAYGASTCLAAGWGAQLWQRFFMWGMVSLWATVWCHYISYMNSYDTLS